ncbi:MAG: hypothetical protein JWM43_3603 [Acidobacteriaceae bacterium]|nr:hypothetical protein [Acidobacteriaceae bacterium]
MVTLKDVHDACAGAYFMGHLQGLGADRAKIQERLDEVVEDAVWKGLLCQSLDLLEQLWAEAAWGSEEVFAPTAEIVRRAIAMQGVAVGWRDGEVQAAPVRSAMLAERINMELDQLSGASHL